MIGVLVAALAADSVPNGAYGMLSLCAALSKASGEAHTTSGRLGDACVYVHLRNSDPATVRAAVADVLHAEWRAKDNAWVLTPKVNPTTSGLPIFTERWAEETKTVPSLANLDARTLYYMPCGERRFFDLQGRPVDPTSANVAVSFFRMAGSIFELGGGTDIDRQLVIPVTSPRVWAALGADAAKPFTIPAQNRPVPRMGGSSMGTISASWANYAKVDPVSLYVGPLLDELAQTLNREIVTALPDAATFSFFFTGEAATARDVVDGLGNCVEWDMDGDRLVGRRNGADTRADPTASRQVLSEFERKSLPVLDTPMTAQMQSRQPAAAANAWNDLSMMALTGNLVEATVSTPWDGRLYLALTLGDWAGLRSGKCTVGDLSSGAQTALANLMRNSRTSRSYAPPYRGLVIGFQEVGEDIVVMKFGTRAPESMDYLNAAAHRVWKGFVEKEATYASAHRQTIHLQVGEQDITFNKLEFPSGRALIPYAQLPEGIRAKIDGMARNMRSERETAPPGGGQP